MDHQYLRLLNESHHSSGAPPPSQAPPRTPPRAADRGAGHGRGRSHRHARGASPTPSGRDSSRDDADTDADEAAHAAVPFMAPAAAEFAQDPSSPLHFSHIVPHERLPGTSQAPRSTKKPRSCAPAEACDRFIPSLSSREQQTYYLGARVPKRKAGTANTDITSADEATSLTYQDFLKTEILSVDQGPNSSVLQLTPSSRRNRDKVLDAPELQDDFYLNLVDWSSKNILGVGLGSCVYLWNAATCSVTKMCDLGSNDTVTSISWIQRGSHLAVGTNKGLVQLWDVERSKKVRQFTGHRSRVGALSWRYEMLASGSRDRSILLRDVREPGDHVFKFTGHRQEVCGLRWSPDDDVLASGGNDNKLFIWDARSKKELSCFEHHKAAIKAIAWSPHERGLLSSGGGTQDKCIRHWNTLTSELKSYVDTNSQVCNLAWSKYSKELVSTHGFSQNKIIVWKYPSMQQIATLTGHSLRVLYLAMSPDGESIVTGAGDETLRFWTVFNKKSPKSAAQACHKPVIR
ncbi:substrate-specific activator of APC-dependent proteolysis [Polyrhizophydium stewartii]|uniref:Substrate-specific activator of APC-dependent proteolysis n=1 Tax=Polyrhizophydium stewartii TaxID=2732419 RepID=A0ABR4NK56_9FUNG